MASGILKRVMLFEYDPGHRRRYWRPSQWNQVSTSIGTMLEQNQCFPLKWARGNGDDFDDTSFHRDDDGYQIDEFTGISSGRVFQDEDGSGNKMSLNGGTGIPQEGP